MQKYLPPENFFIKALISQAAEDCDVDWFVLQAAGFHCHQGIIPASANLLT